MWERKTGRNIMEKQQPSISSMENFYSRRECTLTVTYRLTNMGLQFHSFSPHPPPSFPPKKARLGSPGRPVRARVTRSTWKGGSQRGTPSLKDIRKIQRPHNLSGTCGWAFCACTKRQSKKGKKKEKKIGRPRVTYRWIVSGRMEQVRWRAIGRERTRREEEKEEEKKKKRKDGGVKRVVRGESTRHDRYEAVYTSVPRLLKPVHPRG